MSFRRILFVLLAVVLLTPFAAIAKDVPVKGYFRKDGTYVAPHMRSAPNSTTSDNFSTQGNVNPYTGAPGTKPDTAPLTAPTTLPAIPIVEAPATSSTAVVVSGGPLPLLAEGSREPTDRELLVATLVEVRALRARVDSLEQRLAVAQTSAPVSVVGPSAPALATISVPPERVAWRRLQLGMTKSQVRSILGEPRRAGGSKWQYGDSSYAAYVLFGTSGLIAWEEP